MLGVRTTAKIPPITMNELPNISRHPNGSLVSIDELITPTTISERKRIEHRVLSSI